MFEFSPRMKEMILSCKNCSYENGENDATCIICRFPIKGSDQEKARFISQQVMGKNDVEHAIVKVRYTRIALFVLSGIMLLLTIFILFKSGFWVLASPLCILGILYLFSAIISGKHPVIGMSIAMVITVGIYGLQLLFNPMDLLNGIFWKCIIIMIIFYGFTAVLGANKTLRANPYISEMLGYKSLGKKGNVVGEADILDHSNKIRE